MKFKYLLKGGCGKTDIKLETDSIGKTFLLTYNSRWMGGVNENFTLTGEFNDVNTAVADHYKLYTLWGDKLTYNNIEYNDKDKCALVYITVLNENRKVVYPDLELEGMVMGGVLFNNDDFQYNAIVRINLGQNIILQQITKNKDNDENDKNNSKNFFDRTFKMISC